MQARNVLYVLTVVPLYCNIDVMYMQACRQIYSSNYDSLLRTNIDSTQAYSTVRGSLTLTPLSIIIRSHIKCGTYMCLIGLKPPLQDKKKCVIESLSLTQCPQFFRDHDDILQTHILGGPEGGAKFGPNCSIFRDMAAILNFKNHTGL